MTQRRADLIRHELESLAALARETASAADRIEALADRYAATLRQGGRLFFAGNGGSAADAQHLATEYVVRFREARRPLAALALTTDTSLLTAAGNDLGFEEIFARQVAALCRPGDLLVLHSTSGASANLVRAAETARDHDVPVVAFLGRGGGRLRDLATDALVITSEDTSHIQEMHLAVEHIIVGLVERELAG
jgi:D-sedoheptulose 7-phosphate isomerase